jgi:hypothetical protein
MKKLLLLVLLATLLDSVSGQDKTDIIVLSNDSIVVGTVLNGMGDLDIVVPDGDTLTVPFYLIDYVVYQYDDGFITDRFIKATHLSNIGVAVVFIGTAVAVLAPEFLIVSAGLSVVSIALNIAAWGQFKKIGHLMQVETAMAKGRIWKG